MSRGRHAGEASLAKALGYLSENEAKALRLSLVGASGGSYEVKVLDNTVSLSDLLLEARWRIVKLQRELDEERSVRYQLEEDMGVVRGFKSLLNDL